MSVPDLAERYLGRNVAMLMADAVGFSVGMTLLGTTTILPSLVRELGGGPVAVGLIGLIQAGGYNLPQLLAGRYVANRPLVKKYVVVPATVGRLCLGLTVVALSYLAARAPAVALVVLLAGFAAYCIIDALSVVGWTDLLGKVVPADRRGRVVGASQSISGLVAVGGGLVVRAILARPAGFPGNYLLVLTLSCSALAICPLALGLIREPRATVSSEARLSWVQYFPRLAGILRTDAHFAWLAKMTWLGGLADMSGFFYVGYAMDRLHIAQQTIGLFMSASVVGGLLSGVVLGPLVDRKGAASVITAVMGLRCISPALALSAPFLARQWPWLPSALFLLIYGLMGITGGLFIVGFTPYILEIAPLDERPLYIALGNALAGLLFVAPLLAGWLVEVASYELLFAVTLALACIGLLAGVRRPVPAAASTAGEEPVA